MVGIEVGQFSLSEQIEAPTDEYFFSNVFCDRCFSILDALK